MVERNLYVPDKYISHSDQIARAQKLVADETVETAHVHTHKFMESCNAECTTYPEPRGHSDGAGEDAGEA